MDLSVLGIFILELSGPIKIDSVSLLVWFSWASVNTIVLGVIIYIIIYF